VKEELQSEVSSILRESWTERDGRVVPEPENIGLKNDAVNLDATILYADMSGSTEMVDEYSSHIAAEVYKVYMACAARIIRDEGGAITAYDGDRVMSVFLGDSKNTTAARTALRIAWAVSKIINPSLKGQYGNEAYQMRHCIGIDTSKILVSRIGVRNDNDLVWVGRAANYAAKLSSLEEGYVFLTGTVFDRLADRSKFGGNPRTLMWERRNWTAMNGMTVYRSNWIWPV
jgi:class 3 adenylate cyclase